MVASLPAGAALLAELPAIVAALPVAAEPEAASPPHAVANRLKAVIADTVASRV